MYLMSFLYFIVSILISTLVIFHWLNRKWIRIIYVSTAFEGSFVSNDASLVVMADHRQRSIIVINNCFSLKWIRKNILNIYHCLNSNMVLYFSFVIYITNWTCKISLENVPITSFIPESTGSKHLFVIKPSLWVKS